MTVLCILPLTAILLMKWQTNFYDYVWIWGMVPVTGMIACGVALLITWLWDGKWTKAQKWVATAMIIAVLMLGGGMGNTGSALPDLNAERQEIAQVLAQVRGQTEGQICLLAPREVLAQARSIDPQFILLYGRNMWQGHLNAYSYDVYDQDRRDLYVWMIMIGRYGTLDVPVATDIDIVGERLEPGSHLAGLTMVRKALELGVDKILLPGNMSEESLETLRRELSAQTQKIGAYWLITVPEVMG